MRRDPPCRIAQPEALLGGIREYAAKTSGRLTDSGADAAFAIAEDTSSEDPSPATAAENPIAASAARFEQDIVIGSRGSLSVSEGRIVILAGSIQDLQDCYKRVLKRSPAVAGRLVFTVVDDGAGTVTSLKTSYRVGIPDSLAACCAAVVRRHASARGAVGMHWLPLRFVIDP